MQAKINNTLIKALEPADKQYDVRDTTLKGFMIQSKYQNACLRAICCGTLRNSNSDRHTMRIHGQM